MVFYNKFNVENNDLKQVGKPKRTRKVKNNSMRMPKLSKFAWNNIVIYNKRSSYLKAFIISLILIVLSKQFAHLI